MNPFKRDEPCFLLDPFEHAGRYRGVHGGTMMCWEVKDTMVEPFGDITTAVCTELENYRFPRSMVVMFDLFLRGTSTSSVEVFVMLAGATEQHRKKAVKRLRKSSLAKKYPGLKMDHWNWPPDAPHVVMMAADDDTLPWTTVHRSQGYEIRFSGKSPERSSLDKLGNISYHIVATDIGSAGYGRKATVDSISAPNFGPCDLCRRFSLACTVNESDSGHRGCLSCQKRGSECSFVAGSDMSEQKIGVLSYFVVMGGVRYLLVPAHIFLSDEPDEDDEFYNTGDSKSDFNSESSSVIESGSDVMLRAGSATPPDLESQLASDSATEHNPSDRASIFESSARRKGKRPELPPQSLSSEVPFAKVLSIELDYALVPFPLTGAHDFQADLRHLVEETTARFPGQRNANGTLSGAVEHSISVTTPSQGLMRGTISTRPVMMRLPHSKTFSMLYPLELPSPVQEGDCGSVVFDHLSRVYGFIVAGSMAGNVAYIMPAAAILDDIRSRTSKMPESVSAGPEIQTAQLLPPTDTLAHTYRKATSWKPKMSSWELVISDLPLDADEKYIRGIVPDSEGLEGIIMRLSASKPTGSCRDAILTFSSEAATLSAYNSIKRQDPTNMTLQLGSGDQNMWQTLPADEHIPTPPPSKPLVYEQEPIQDPHDLGRPKDTIIRPRAGNDMPQANNDQIRIDLNLQKAELAGQASVIQALHRQRATADVHLRNALERIASLEKLLAEERERHETASSTSMKYHHSHMYKPGYVALPARQTSPPLYKRHWSDLVSTEVLSQGVKPNDQQSSEPRRGFVELRHHNEKHVRNNDSAVDDLYESPTSDTPFKNDRAKRLKTGNSQKCVRCDAIFNDEDNGSDVCQYHAGIMQLFDATKISGPGLYDDDTEANRAAFPDAYRWLCCLKAGSHPGCRRGHHEANHQLSLKRQGGGGGVLEKEEGEEV